MSLRFRKSFKVAPGVKLNLNKKSASVTFGGKGFHHTLNSSGRKTTSVGIPGTGLYYQDISDNTSSPSNSGSSSNNYQYGYNNGNNNYNNDDNDDSIVNHTGLMWFFLIIFPPAGLVYLWTNKIHYNKKKKCILSVVFGLYTFILLSIAFGGGNSNDTSTASYVQEQTTTTVQSTTKSTTAKTTAAAKSTKATIVTATEKATEAPKTEAVTELETEPQTEPETERTTAERTTAERTVWIDDTGKKYHNKSSCSNMDAPYQVLLSEAEQRGYTPCKKCYR